MPTTVLRRVSALALALLLSLAGVAALSTPAAADHPNRLIVNIALAQNFPLPGVQAPGPSWEDLVLELYDGDGALVAEGWLEYDEDTGWEAHESVAESLDLAGATCFAQINFSFFIESFSLICDDLPHDTYTLGADNYAPFLAEALCEAGTIAEPLEGGDAVIEIGGTEYQWIDCQILLDSPGGMLLGLLGAMPPYDYTASPSSSLTATFLNTTTDTEILFSSEGESSELCGGGDIGSAWVLICLLPSGHYIPELEAPEGLVAGPFQCLSLPPGDFMDVILEDVHEVSDLLTTGEFEVVADGTVICSVYLGTGVPLYVDLTGDDLTEADLAAITIEAYDETGALAATAKDPSLGTCEATPTGDLPEHVASGIAVQDDSVCAVLWVAPPTLGLLEILLLEILLGEGDLPEFVDISTTYTIGIAGATVTHHTLGVTDLTWTLHPSSDDDDDDDSQDDAQNEPLSSAAVTLSVIVYLDSDVPDSFSSGALIALDATLDGLAATGPAWAAPAAVATALLMLGLAGLAAQRRRRA